MGCQLLQSQPEGQQATLLLAQVQKWFEGQQLWMLCQLRGLRLGWGGCTYKSGCWIFLQLIGASAGQTAGSAGRLLLLHFGQCAGCQYPDFPPALTKVIMLKHVTRNSCALFRLVIIVACVC